MLALAGRITPERGAMIISMRRPSIIGVCSTWAMSLVASHDPLEHVLPGLGMDDLAAAEDHDQLGLVAFLRNRRMCFTLKSKSWSSVLGRNLISLSVTVDWCLRASFFFLDVLVLELAVVHDLADRRHRPSG